MKFSKFDGSQDPKMHVQKFEEAIEFVHDHHMLANYAVIVLNMMHLNGILLLSNFGWSDEIIAGLQPGYIFAIVEPCNHNHQLDRRDLKNLAYQQVTTVRRFLE